MTFGVTVSHGGDEDRNIVALGDCGKYMEIWIEERYEDVKERNQTNQTRRLKNT